jgi:tetratricopeptide (TPR) repeat protein
MEKGQSFESFKKNIKPLLQQKGWWGKKEMTDPLTGKTVNAQLGSDRRLKTIYRVNMRSAYQKGQYDRTMASDLHPYLMYRIGPSVRHREDHQSWDGLILPKNDPWWDSHFPPNGWGCKCYTRAVTEARKKQYEENGIPTAPRLDGTGGGNVPAKTQAPPVKYKTYFNERKGTVEQVPEGVDPAFNWNQGRAPGDSGAKAVLENAQRKYAEAAGDVVSVGGTADKQKAPPEQVDALEKARRRLEEAERNYEKAVAEKPQNLKELGKALKELERAERNYEKAAAEKPQNEGGTDEQKALPEKEAADIEKILGIQKGEPIEIERAYKEANPNKYQDNCQRCVTAYELRRRGYNVTAMPRHEDNGPQGHEAFNNPIVIGPECLGGKLAGLGKKNLIGQLNSLPDGSRCGILIKYPGSNNGHTFVCEKVNGGLQFYDPQTGEECFSKLDKASRGYLAYYRMDNLSLSAGIDWKDYVRGKS